MSGKTAFSLRRRLIGGLAVANLIVLGVNTPYFLWRGYLDHDMEIASGREAFSNWLLHELLTDVIPLTLPLLIANLLFVVWIVRTSLAPIQALSRQAGGFDAAHLGDRLSVEGVPGEIRPLIDAVNKGLERISEGFESQRRFTANAAHELRTPLAVLRARCSGADCATLPKLSADVDRMARIVDQLLSIARLEMRQFPLDQTVDVNAVCRQLVGDLYPLALATGVELSFAADGEWRLLSGNGILLGDAIRNLIENAVRLSPEGGAVELELGPPGVIRVLDRGPGVEEGMKEEIFLPFRRGKSAKGGGAGLGLSIASEVVGLHGGALSVSGRAGGGAVFSIDFPGTRLVRQADVMLPRNNLRT
jgi:signal transduction histidine kinase